MRIIEINDIEDMCIDGVDMKDHQDFSDAFFNFARWKESGKFLTEEELDQLSEESPELLNTMAHESLY